MVLITEGVRRDALDPKWQQTDRSHQHSNASGFTVNTARARARKPYRDIYLPVHETDSGVLNALGQLIHEISSGRLNGTQSIHCASTRTRRTRRDQHSNASGITVTTARARARKPCPGARAKTLTTAVLTQSIHNASIQTRRTQRDAQPSHMQDPAQPPSGPYPL